MSNAEGIHIMNLGKHKRSRFNFEHFYTILTHITGLPRETLVGTRPTRGCFHADDTLGTKLHDESITGISAEPYCPLILVSD